MKFNKIFNIIIISLLIIIPSILLIGAKTSKEEIKLDIKEINAKRLAADLSNIKVATSVYREEKKKVEVKQEEKKTEVNLSTNTESLNNSQSISSGSGRVTYYTLNCAGCGGRVAAGSNLDGIYYNDPTYGHLRVLATGREFPFGTVIKISGSALGEFYGIALDRGGAIGMGRKNLFDILVNTTPEAYSYGVSYVNYEVIRMGY